MRPTRQIPAVPRPSFREVVCAAAAIAACIVAVTLLFDAASRVTRPLWLDESITALLANDDGFAHMLRAIHGGAENNPPIFYVILWPVARVFGGLGAVGLRVVAGVAIVAALTGMYAVARLYVGRLSAAVGTAVVASHPMVVGQMFEARFYGAWLAATVWFAFTMVLHPSGGNERRLLIWRCTLAFFTATIHWFGILIVALVVAGAMVRASFGTSSTDESWRQQLAPAAVALLGVVLFSPFLLSQRSGLAVPTWIEPTTARSVAGMAYRLFYNPGGLLIGILLVIWIVRRPRGRPFDTKTLAEWAPVSMLIVFPVIISALSMVVQPLLYERYLIPSVLALGMAAAALVPTSNRRVVGVGLVLVVSLAVSLGREMRRYNRAVAVADWRIQNALSTVDGIVASNGPVPVVFMRRFEQYPVIQLRPGVAAAIALVDFDGAPAWLMRRTIFERDMARRMARFYPDHRLVGIDSLRRLAEFFAITSENEEAELRLLLRGFEIDRRAPDVYHVSR